MNPPTWTGTSRLFRAACRLGIPSSVALGIAAAVGGFSAPRFRLKTPVAHALGLSGDALKLWHRRMAVGMQLNDFLLAWPDCRPLFADQSSFPGDCKGEGGLMFVAGHIGPRRAGALAARRMEESTLILTRNRSLMPKGDRQMVDDGRVAAGQIMTRDYLRAYAKLSTGGSVYMAADGQAGSGEFRAYSFLGETVRLCTAVPGLARKTGCTCIPFAVTWRGKRLGLHWGEALPEGKGTDEEEWVTTFHEKYLHWAEAILRESPLNWRVANGLVSFLVEPVRGGLS